MNKFDESLLVAVDSREQLPYNFPRSEVTGLRTGDYGIINPETGELLSVAIERKSKGDAYGSLGHGRARFEREWMRLSELDYAAVVIESSLKDFLIPPRESIGMNPKAAICTLLGWSVKYRVPVFFAGGRQHGQSTTYNLLRLYWRYFNEGRLIRPGRYVSEGAGREGIPC